MTRPVRPLKEDAWNDPRRCKFCFRWFENKIPKDGLHKNCRQALKKMRKEGLTREQARHSWA